MPRTTSKQEGFAANLGGTALGTAVYQPIKMRDKSGRVGDVAFFNKVGKYVWLRNAFDTLGLRQWSWGEFLISEDEAVSEEEPGHFKVAVGGQAKLTWGSVEVGGEGPPVPGVTAGGKIKVTKHDEGSSFSVMVPGEDPLRFRGALDDQNFNLINWFAVNEAAAWTAVNSYYAHERPSKIFLVIGQTMTSEYSITHQHEQSSGCAIILSGKVEIPSVLGGSTLFGWGVEKVTASTGFETSMKGAGHHSVFLDTYPSSPMKIINILDKSLKVRIGNMFNFFKKNSGQASSQKNDLPFVAYTSRDGSQTTPASTPDKAPMDSGETTEWHLLQLPSGDYAVQYSGEDPDAHFPSKLNGLIPLDNRDWYTKRSTPWDPTPNRGSTSTLAPPAFGLHKSRSQTNVSLALSPEGQSRELPPSGTRVPSVVQDPITAGDGLIRFPTIWHLCWFLADKMPHTPDDTILTIARCLRADHAFVRNALISNIKVGTIPSPFSPQERWSIVQWRSIEGYGCPTNSIVLYCYGYECLWVADGWISGQRSSSLSEFAAEFAAADQPIFNTHVRELACLLAYHLVEERGLYRGTVAAEGFEVVSPTGTEEAWQKWFRAVLQYEDKNKPRDEAWKQNAQKTFMALARYKRITDEYSRQYHLDPPPRAYKELRDSRVIRSNVPLPSALVFTRTNVSAGGQHWVGGLPTDEPARTPVSAVPKLTVTVS